MTSNTAVTTTETLSVVVRKKDGIIFQGPAESITSTNDKGIFDILPKHTNFVAVIKNTLIIRPVQKPAITMSVPRGIIHVKKKHCRSLHRNLASQGHALRS